MKEIKINLNNYVKIKLTQKGVDRYDEITAGLKYPRILIPSVDKDGYTKMQFHEFIYFFGGETALDNFIESFDILYEI